MLEPTIHESMTTDTLLLLSVPSGEDDAGMYLRAA